MPDSTTTSAMNDGVLILPSRSIESAPRDRIKTIASGMQRHPIVIVLGMHRSGTSLCSHILSALGVDMTDKIEGPGNAAPTSDNPHGHWERWEIVEFHDRILGLFNRDYSGRFHDFALPVAWWADPRVVQIRREIVAFLEKRLGEGYFGFKDPRTVRLLPMWHQILRELRLFPKVVFCLRNPALVARSLYVRDRLDPEVGEYRWLVHVIDFFRYSNSLDFCTVEYEDWFIDPFGNLNKLTQFLDLPWQQSQSDLALLLSGIIDPRARHDGRDYHEAGQPLVRSLYKLASQANKDITARDQIGSIVAQFVGFQQLQRPFHLAFEDVAKTADKYTEIEQERAALRASADERNALIEAQRCQLEELARERAARVVIESEVRSLEIALAEREAALTELSHRTDELSAALGSARAERLALQETLQRAEQEAQQRAGAADALQGKVAALREAQETCREQTGAMEVLKAETRALRGSLVKAEEAAADRAAEVTAMQAEITVLKDMLAAARQVGRAAIDAFRINVVVPREPVSPRRWRQAMVRVFRNRAATEPSLDRI